MLYDVIVNYTASCRVMSRHIILGIDYMMSDATCAVYGSSGDAMM